MNGFYSYVYVHLTSYVLILFKFRSSGLCIIIFRKWRILKREGCKGGSPPFDLKKYLIWLKIAKEKCDRLTWCNFYIAFQNPWPFVRSHTLTKSWECYDKTLWTFHLLVDLMKYSSLGVKIKRGHRIVWIYSGSEKHVFVV